MTFFRLAGSKTSEKEEACKKRKLKSTQKYPASKEGFYLLLKI